MALNWTMLSPDKSPVPLPHELIIRTVDHGVEVSLSIPDAPPTYSNNAKAGGSGGMKRLKEWGRIWLTDQRLIFVSDASPNPSFESLSIPLTSLLSTKFEQPYFGANYLALDVKPTPEGGLTDGTKVEIRFKDKGIFEFASSLDKTRERAIYMKRQQVDEEEGLPSYSSPVGEQGGLTPLSGFTAAAAAATAGESLPGSATGGPGPNSIPMDGPPGYEA
ncbi:WW domain-binding protein 2-like protein [Abortiporus biennis]